MAGKEENEKKDGGSKGAQFSDTSKLALDTLRIAHANYLASMWSLYGNVVYVGSVMHAVHAAMFKYEMDFLNDMQGNTDEKGEKS